MRESCLVYCYSGIQSLFEVVLLYTFYTRGLSLGDKIKDYVDRNNRGQVYSLHEVTQLWKYSQTKMFIFEWSNEKNSFLENENIFSQKNYTTIIRTYWVTECESRSEIEFWATCHNVSNLCDGC